MKSRGKPKTKVSEAVVKDALREALRKFIGPFGFSTIKDADRNSGPISKSPCRQSTWDELFRENIVQRHHISGVSDDGLNISGDQNIRHEVRNFLDNAALGAHLHCVVQGILRRS